MPNMDDQVMRDYYERARAERVAARQKLIETCNKHGVAKVEVEFDGYGDEGSTHMGTSHDPEVEAAAEDFAYFVLEEHFPGWEINDGSAGFDPHRRRHRQTRYRVRLPLHGRRVEQQGGEPVMAHPYHHATSSAKRWGGTPEDYLGIHEWFDETKAHHADFRHRALRHHAEGIFLCERIFGVTLTNSDGRAIPVRWVGEQHVREDLGVIPAATDWLREIAPRAWMARTGSKEAATKGRGDAA
jgi:hypothetical protein